MKKEEFKEFVKKNPKLVSYVKTNEMTWQKFYEMYDLYGEDENVWKDYISKTPQSVKSDNNTNSSTAVNAGKAGVAGLTLSEVVNWFKNVDLDGIQEGIGNVQRVLGVVQDFSKKDVPKTAKEPYNPRPLYKHFED